MELSTGEIIHIERRRRRMSISELSELAGVSAATISNFENGETVIGADALLAICSALEISPDRVFSPKA